MPTEPDNILLPSNRGEYPIQVLIDELSKLPPGTTYNRVAGDGSELHGGETPDNALGTAYRLSIEVVEGFNPPRSK